MMSATEEAKQEEQTDIASTANNNDTNDVDNDKAAPPTPKRAKSSSDILTKLRNILDGVASQEADLKRKTHKIEEWYNLHRDALKLAATTKKKLIEFEIIRDDDDDDMVTLKTKNKTEINSSLDKLEKHLKKINLTEKKYRSRECILEQNELNETIKKLQNKYKMISKKYNLCQSDLDKLRIQNVENENKIKQLIENNKKMIESTKKELIQKHKNYITNLQSQHENLLKKQKDENIKNTEKQYLSEKNTLNTKIENLENEIIRIKKENENDIDKKLNNLNTEKQIEINKYKMDIDRIENDYKMIENKLIEKEEELSSYKLREKAHKELMLKWQAQKEKKNEKINNLSLNIEKLNLKIENLEENNQRLQETTAFNSIQITQKDEKFNDIDNKYNNQCIKICQMDKDKKLLEAKLKVSIKEIIKLRQETKDRDENKNNLLTEMSNMEISKNKKIKLLNIDIDKLKNEILLNNHEYDKKFELININLNDLHSKLESFSVTIRNFSGKSLLQNKTFDTEIEAAKKSNEELPAWQYNIREQVRKATEQLTISSTLSSLDDKETQTQIAHIKLTGLQLLHEYTSLLLEYNNLYITTYEKQEKQQQQQQQQNNNQNNNTNSNKKKFKRGK